jgi:hypothetical protein
MLGPVSSSGFKTKQRPALSLTAAENSLPGPMHATLINENPLVPGRESRVGGRTYSCLQATVQAPQPVHLFKSINMA